MGYRYREVRCPLCERNFMWSTETYFGSAYEFYRVKDTGEKVGKATCTTCGIDLAVFKGVLEGVLPEEREDLVSIRERGI